MENGEGEITRLTNGSWVDTHCEWSPNGEWIVFASNRNRPSEKLDHGLDTGYFAVYLVKANDPDVWVRVIGSRSGDLAGRDENNQWMNLHHLDTQLLYSI